MAKRILMISPVPTHPPTSGKRVGIDALARTFAALGHETHILFTDHEQGDVAAMRAAWGDRFHHAPYRWPPRTPLRSLRRLRYLFREGFRELRPVDAWYDSSLDAVLRDLHARFRFDVAVAEYVFWSKALEQFPAGVLKLVDTHDAFSDRHLLYTRRKLPYGWFSTPPEEEAKGLSRADVVVAVSDGEAAYFRRLVRKKVTTVGRLVDVARPDEARPVAGRMLFVGADTSINADGLAHFVEAVLPRIRIAVPGAELYVAGEAGGKVSPREGVIPLGVVPDLRAVYASASVVVNPVRFSTGLSIKSVEALGQARPLVTTAAGAAGLPERLAGVAAVVDGDAQFAAAVVRLLRDGAEAARMSEAAHNFALGWNRQCVAALAAVIESGTGT